MKLNINCGQNVRDDCINIDNRVEHSLQENVLYTSNYGDLFDKNQLPIQTRSVDEIIVNAGTFEKMDKDMIGNTLLYFKSILKKNGNIKIYLLDIYPLCNKFINDQISIEDFELEVLSSETLLTTPSMVSTLYRMGFTVETTNLQDVVGVIHARSS